MKTNEKRLILILLLLLIIVIIIKLRAGAKPSIDESSQTNTTTEEFVQLLEDGTKVNTSETLQQAKQLGNLQFTNIQLTNQNGQSVLLAEVKNTGTTATELQLIDIIILDKNGEQLGKVGGIVTPLEPNESTQFNTSMTRDYANAYDFQVVEKEVE